MSATLNKVLVIGELRVTVRELTVGEVRVMFKRMAEMQNPDPVDETLLEEISLVDLKLMTDLPDNLADDLTPSQLRQIYETCREVNPDFFALRERVELLGQRLLDQLSTVSNATPAP